MKEKTPQEIQYLFKLLLKHKTQLYEIGGQLIEITATPIDMSTGVRGKRYHAILINEQVGEKEMEELRTRKV